MLSLTAGTVHSCWMNNELFTKELGAWKNKSCIANLLNLLTIKETFKHSNGSRQSKLTYAQRDHDYVSSHSKWSKCQMTLARNGLVSGTTAGSSARVETTLCDYPQSDFVRRSSSSNSVWALHHRGPCIDTGRVLSFLEASASLLMKLKC